MGLVKIVENSKLGYTVYTDEILEELNSWYNISKYEYGQLPNLFYKVSHVLEEILRESNRNNMLIAFDVDSLTRKMKNFRGWKLTPELDLGEYVRIEQFNETNVYFLTEKALELFKVPKLDSN